MNLFVRSHYIDPFGYYQMIASTYARTACVSERSDPQTWRLAGHLKKTTKGRQQSTSPTRRTGPVNGGILRAVYSRRTDVYRKQNA